VRRLLAAALLLGACATDAHDAAQHPPRESPAAEEQEASRAHDELRRLDAELRGAEAQAAAPDCGRVGQLRDNICALAARICQIAERQPARSTTAERCADGKLRCKNAVERAQARGCPKK
jgi:hypothetical protein